MEFKLQANETEIITQLYRGLLLREPDPEGLERYAANLQNGTALSKILYSIVHSPEFWARQHLTISSPFNHYNSAIDAQGLIQRHAVPNPTPMPGYLTNFLGVRIDPKFFPEILTGRGGEVENLPLPTKFHADIAEWAAVLRAVELARSAVR